MGAEPAAGDHSGERSTVSRREFLTVAWLAAIGALLAEAGVVTYRFVMPQASAGDLGGPVSVGTAEAVAAFGAEPRAFDGQGFWMVNTPRGALALGTICTHLGCLCAWKSDQGKFYCPCHGSQFGRDGLVLSGPAPRGLDRMVIRAYDSSGAMVAQTDGCGDPLPLPAGTTVVVYTNEIVPGPAA